MGCEKVCKLLAEFISLSLSLKSLSLENCRIGSIGSEHLSEGIAISQSLEMVNLRSCLLEDVGGEFMINALTINETIKEVDLSHNRLGLNSGKSLGNLFINNTVIENINLEWNELGAVKSIQSMMNGLRTNNAVKIINLSWNGLKGSTFLKPFRLMIKRNTTLNTVFLRHLSLQDEIDFKSVATVIRTTKSLKQLHIGGAIDWTTEHIRLILEACEKRDIPLEFLSLGSDYYITAEMELLVETAKTSNPNLTIEYQDIWLKNPPEPVNFKGILMDRCKFLALKPKKAKQKRNMG